MPVPAFLFPVSGSLSCFSGSIRCFRRGRGLKTTPRYRPTTRKGLKARVRSSAWLYKYFKYSRKKATILEKGIAISPQAEGSQLVARTTTGALFLLNNQHLIYAIYTKDRYRSSQRLVCDDTFFSLLEESLSGEACVVVFSARKR